MRKACRLASECLAWIVAQVQPGMSTQDIDDLQVQFCEKHGVKAAPLHYGGIPGERMPFPKSICTSVNEVICHGIPDKNHTLKEGDIVGVDVTLIVDGFHGDNAATIPVGQVSDDTMKLLEVSLEANRAGIAAVMPGGRIGDIGAAIQEAAEPKGFSVVYEFVGHGIGRVFHEDPQIPHVGNRGQGKRMKPGMTFTVEPMINVGVAESMLLKDGWTAITADRKLSAQYEHTMVVTEDGVEILTVQNDDGSWEPPGRWYPPGWQ